MSKFHVAGVLCYASEDGDELVSCVETIVEAVDSDSALWAAAKEEGVDLDNPEHHAYFDEKYNDVMVQEVPEDSYLLNIHDELLDIIKILEKGLHQVGAARITELSQRLTGDETVVIAGGYKWNLQ